MKVAIAYVSVVFIWATTPLAIKWSSSSISFVAACASRILIALAVSGLLMVALRRPLIKRKSDWWAFVAGLVGTFPNVLLIYWSAQHIPSGLGAVIFGMYPFAVGIFSFLILKENIFNLRRVLAIGIALAGLVVINIDQFQVGGKALLGVLGIAVGVMFFGLSSVWVKRVGADVDPLAQTTGVLLLAAPLLLISWFVLDGELPLHWDAHSLFGVSYSAVAGSVVGSVLFFYILAKCKVASVGLITFVTPIMALVIGAAVNGEQFSMTTVLGSVLVIVALGVYQDALRLIANVWRSAAIPVQAELDSE
ncbi:MAG: DMT family transporter [Agarilytica sp.]